MQTMGSPKREDVTPSSQAEVSGFPVLLQTLFCTSFENEIHTAIKMINTLFLTQTRKKTGYLR